MSSSSSPSAVRKKNPNTMSGPSKRKRREILTFSIPKMREDGDDEFRIDGDDYRALSRFVKGICPDNESTPQIVRRISRIRDNDNERRVRGLHVESWTTPGDKDWEKICNLSELNTLEVRDTIGPTISSSIGMLQNLETLDIEYGNLETIPEAIGNLTRLKKLRLCDTLITSLPPAVGRLQKLEVLDVNFFLTALPQEIGDLVNLKILSMRATDITSLPPSVGRLQNLQVLDATDSNLEIIPKEIGDLVSLRGLRLRSTQIASLPSSVGQLEKLEVLDISMTNLKTIPKEIGQLTGLINLNLEGVKLESLPNFVHDLSNLEALELVYRGKLRWGSTIKLSPDSFEKMKRLRYLTLSYDQRNEEHRNVLPIVQGCRSLLYVSINGRAPSNQNVLYVLACNRARSRSTLQNSEGVLPSLWPRILTNASRAFAWIPEEHETRKHRLIVHDWNNQPMIVENTEDGSPWEDGQHLPGLDQHDAMYRLLVDGRESFVGVLANRCRQTK